jgi:hypothetical protein
MKRKRWPFVVSIVLLLHGWFCVTNSRQIQQHAEQLPKIACEQLIENGPGRSWWYGIISFLIGGPLLGWFFYLRVCHRSDLNQDQLDASASH